MCCSLAKVNELTNRSKTSTVFSDTVTPLSEIIEKMFCACDISVSLKTFSFSFHQRGLLYQGLHSGSSMVAMGKAGLLGHTLGGYGLPSPGASGTSAVQHQFCSKFSISYLSSHPCLFSPDYSQPGFYHSVSLQRGAMNPWQPVQPPQEPHGPHISPG